MRVVRITSELYQAEAVAISSTEFGLKLNGKLVNISKDALDDLGHSIRVAMQESDYIAMQESEDDNDCGLPF